MNGSPPSTAAGSDALTFEAPQVFGSGPFNLAKTEAGLDGLSSYTATLKLSFDGTRAGQPSTWSKIYVMLATTSPAARQLTIQKSGDVADPAQVLMAEVSGAAYEKNAQDACTATAIAPDDTLAQRFEPAGLLAGVVGADAAGSETLNGVPADHYTFDEHALGQVGRATSTGEMWVASGGGYILKYLLTTKGTPGYFGDGIDGTLRWDYQLTGIGQRVTIKLPDDCPLGMVDVPRLPDASNVTDLPSLLTYRTSKRLADIAAFYKKQIPTLGWALGSAPTITNTSMVVGFTRGTATLTVIATVDQGVTTVQVEVTN